MKENDEDLQSLFARIKSLIGSIKYGSITLVIQDGKIVQIESHDKVRLK